MTEATDLGARLGFDIGGYDGIVYFDNILLRKGEEITTSSNFSGLSESSFSLKCYPNPVINQTSFYYTLKKSSRVSLRIFNSRGQEVETLENSFKQQGDHTITWQIGELPDGIYFYYFQLDSESVIRKLVLIK
jgi:hypothetical protein